MQKANINLFCSDHDCSRTIIQRFHDRQEIFIQGDAKRFAYQVISGAVCLYKTLPEGGRHIFAFAFQGDLFALEAQATHSLSAQALGTTRLGCFPFAALSKRAALDAKFAVKLYQAVSDELDASRNLRLMNAKQGSAERVALFVLGLIRLNRGKPANSVALPMTRSDIGDFLGMTIETVSRALSKLCDQGIIQIEGRSKIKINDIDGLMAVAGPDALDKDYGPTTDGSPKS